MYHIVLGLVKLISWLPFPLLYALSDVSYFFVYWISGYRKKVVRENIRRSFPEKTARERMKIEKKFYRHFCDLLFEGFKLLSISEREMNRRMKYVDYEPAIKHYDENRSVMLLTSHYGNWEWTSSFSLRLPKDKPVYQVYRRLRSGLSDKIIYVLRRQFGAENVEMNDLYRTLIKMKKDGKLGLFGMISDQCPERHSIHYTTQFLNQETPMISGTEQIARKYNYPVYYIQVRKERRGYYTCTFIPVSTEPRETAENEITEKYARMLELEIQREPAFWLWTHKRWKYVHDYL